MARLLAYCLVAGAVLTLGALVAALIMVPLLGDRLTPGVLDVPTFWLLSGFFIMFGLVGAIAELRSLSRIRKNADNTLRTKITLALTAGLFAAIVLTFAIHVLRFARVSHSAPFALFMTALVLYLSVTPCLLISFMLARLKGLFQHGA